MLVVNTTIQNSLMNKNKPFYMYKSSQSQTTNLNLMRVKTSRVPRRREKLIKMLNKALKHKKNKETRIIRTVSIRNNTKISKTSKTLINRGCPKMVKLVKIKTVKPLIRIRVNSSSNSKCFRTKWSNTNTRTNMLKSRSRKRSKETSKSSLIKPEKYLTFHLITITITISRGMWIRISKTF